MSSITSCRGGIRQSAAVTVWYAECQRGGCGKCREEPRMSRTDSGAVGFLDQVYTELRLTEGLLFAPASVPTDETIDHWQGVGDWLNLAERMDADRIFFVGDDPVLVFSALPDGASERDAIRVYRQAWSLARPQCLFLATPDELKVYDLSQPPPQTSQEWARQP